jgi:hypothetical protein
MIKGSELEKLYPNEVLAIKTDLVSKLHQLIAIIESQNLQQNTTTSLIIITVD